jgi:hypothetical protein
MLYTGFKDEHLRVKGIEEGLNKHVIASEAKQSFVRRRLPDLMP